MKMEAIQSRIHSLSLLNEKIQENPRKLDEVIQKSHQHNPWFTTDNIKMAWEAIFDSYLTKENLQKFVSKYQPHTGYDRLKTIGLILAGNIPMVGFHDILCSFLSGNKTQIKLSDKDRYLIPFILNQLVDFDEDYKHYFSFVERLDHPDAVIATGSNNTSLYFKKYFSSYPHIIRKNRNGIAVLDGSETKEEIMALGQDIFSYFGLGCRNVSKIYIPEGYGLEFLMESLHEFNEMILHNKYKNNYDYNYAIYLMNKENFLMNGALILREHKDIISRIACLHYERYRSLESLEVDLKDKRDDIQCIVSKIQFEQLSTIPFGTSQSPGLADFADGVDTMDFLLNF